MGPITASHRDIVLITGCSSGIGLALVRLLARSDLRLVATAPARSLSVVASVLGDRDPEFTMIRPLDVSNQRSHGSLIEEISQRWGPVTILVNNAGICYRATLEDMHQDDFDEQMAVNFFGPLSLIRAVLPGMRSMRRGKIINVSSVGGMMAMPTMGAYSASKFALEGASEALYYELRPWNIQVTLVEPGFVRSDSFTHIRLPHDLPSLSHHPYRRYYQSMERFVTRWMYVSPSTPESVARRIMKVIHANSGSLRVSGTPDALVFALMRRLLPGRLYHEVLYRLLPGVRGWVPPAEPGVPAKETTPSEPRVQGGDR